MMLPSGFCVLLAALSINAAAPPAGLASDVQFQTFAAAETANAQPVELAQRGRPPIRPRIPEPVRIDPIPRIGEPPTTGVRIGTTPIAHGRVAPIAGAATLLGGTTAKSDEAKFLVTKRDGQIVVQSNYRPEGQMAGSMPRAVVVENGQSLETAMARALDAGRPETPSDALERLREMDRANRPTPGTDQPESLADRMDKALRIRFGRPPIGQEPPELIIDARLVGIDGRLPINLPANAHIRLFEGNEILPTGKIELLNHEKPPPPLMETLSGCCLKGQPPGRKADIMRRLASRHFGIGNTKVASLVVDSATASAFRSSSALRRIGRPAKGEGQSWSGYLAAEMREASGKNLILLTHVEGSKVVVESPRGEPLYEVEIAELHRMASEANVELVLIGCETASKVQKMPSFIGVAGRYNTARAAERLGQLLRRQRNGADFMEALATEDLIIVAQPGSWSSQAAGAALYARPRVGPKRWVRLMRIWFLGGDDDGQV